MIDPSLFQNKHDYQILARHSIFTASVSTIKYNIERCLKGEAVAGLPERKSPEELKKIKKNNNAHLTKTAVVLKAKLK